MVSHEPRSVLRQRSIPHVWHLREVRYQLEGIEAVLDEAGVPGYIVSMSQTVPSREMVTATGNYVGIAMVGYLESLTRASREGFWPESYFLMAAAAVFAISLATKSTLSSEDIGDRQAL